MKKPLLVSVSLLGLMVAMAPTASRAEESFPLGDGNIALKLDYLLFTDGRFDKVLTQDDGLYVGLEGYGRVFESFYLGGEVGQGVNIDVLGEDINFVPIEVNAKFAFEVVPHLIADLGAGISGVYVEISDRGPFGTGRTDDDWLVAGQFFGDLTYRIRWFSIGGHVKYQLTEDFGGEDFDFDNLRVGMHLGGIF